MSKEQQEYYTLIKKLHEKGMVDWLDVFDELQEMHKYSSIKKEEYTKNLNIVFNKYITKDIIRYI